MLRVILLGYGEVGARVAKLLLRTPRAFSVTAVRRTHLPSKGLKTLNLDAADFRSLKRLPRHTDVLVHLIPPSTLDVADCRVTRHVLAHCQAALGIYVSTTGVYGDRQGEWVDEHCSVKPESPRAARRVAAEVMVRNRGHMVLRVPGIYAAERLPVERLHQGTPAITASEDSYSNHIHADDLARLIVHLIRAQHRAKARVYNAVDDAPMKMGDYFDAVATALALPKCPRLPRSEVAAQVSAMQYSFMRESRRIHNQRLREELAFNLRYPTVPTFLNELTQTS